jgi:hypothetical protein
MIGSLGKSALALAFGLSVGLWLGPVAAQETRLVPGGWARPIRVPEPPPAAAPPLAPKAAAVPPARRRPAHPRAAPVRSAPPADGKVQF